MKPHFLCFLLLWSSKSWAQPVSTLAQASAFSHQQKAAFEINKGQVWNHHNQPAREVQYHYRKGGLDLFLLPTGLAYQFSQTHYPEGYKRHLKKPLSLEEQAQQRELRQQIQVETYRMDMTLVGAHPNPTIVAEGKSQDYVQYYNRNALNVHSFQKVTYQDIYPGIDWVLYTTEKGLKYDFVVHPGADPSQIQLSFSHHEGLQLNPDGSFTLSNRMGRVTEEAPVSFQGTNEVKTCFVLKGNRLSFEVGEYDACQALVIDPTLLWATYYGGTGSDDAKSCKIDANGDVYVAGRTASFTNISAGGHQIPYSGNIDAFLVKFNSSGVRQWATYYGGSGLEYDNTCEIDANGNVYLSGTTGSSTNIAFNGHQNTYGGGDEDAFLVKFNSSGVRQWATYYGGFDGDGAAACAVDASGQVYIVGSTRSSANVSSNGHQNVYLGDLEAFLVKFDGNGVRQWATYYGGNDFDAGRGCAIDANGNVYITGYTSSVGNISTSGSHQFVSNRTPDAFLVKFNSNGVRQWGTYYGGLGVEEAQRCATDVNGNVYITGYTTSDSMAFNGHQDTLSGGFGDAFLVKFDGNGVRQWATYYGGSDDDLGNSCTTDANGNVYLVGSTSSTMNIASTGSHQDAFNGGFYDAFLVKFNSNGVRQWGTYYGGVGSDGAADCAIDPSGQIYLLGGTNSSNSIASGGHQTTIGGDFDAFLAKFSSSRGVNVSTLPSLPNITLYPNPSTGQLTIDLGELQTASIRMYSLSGQLLGQQANLQGPIQQLELPQMPGMYVLEIETELGISYHQVMKKAR